MFTLTFHLDLGFVFYSRSNICSIILGGIFLLTDLSLIVAVKTHPSPNAKLHPGYDLALTVIAKLHSGHNIFSAKSYPGCSLAMSFIAKSYIGYGLAGGHDWTVTPDRMKMGTFQVQGQFISQSISLLLKVNFQYSDAQWRKQGYMAPLL